MREIGSWKYITHSEYCIARSLRGILSKGQPTQPMRSASRARSSSSIYPTRCWQLLHTLADPLCTPLALYTHKHYDVMCGIQTTRNGYIYYTTYEYMYKSIHQHNAPCTLIEWSSSFSEIYASLQCFILPHIWRSRDDYMSKLCVHIDLIWTYGPTDCSSVAAAAAVAAADRRWSVGRPHVDPGINHTSHHQPYNNARACAIVLGRARSRLFNDAFTHKDRKSTTKKCVYNRNEYYIFHAQRRQMMPSASVSSTAGHRGNREMSLEF